MSTAHRAEEKLSRKLQRSCDPNTLEVSEIVGDNIRALLNHFSFVMCFQEDFQSAINHIQRSLKKSHHIDSSCMALGAHCSHIGHSSCATKALLPAVMRERRDHYLSVQTHTQSTAAHHSCLWGTNPAAPASLG